AGSRTWPLLTACAPARQRSRVVRPAPSPPTTALTWPGTARKVTWSSASLSPYRTHASSVPHQSRVAVATGPAPLPGDGSGPARSPCSRGRGGRPARAGPPGPRGWGGPAGPAARAWRAAPGDPAVLVAAGTAAPPVSGTAGPAPAPGTASAAAGCRPTGAWP